MKRNGFTLVEIMIVVAILGILAAIAVPMYNGYMKTSKRSEAKANLETIRLLEEQYYADNRIYAQGEYKAGSTTLQTVLPGFQPGNAADLYYEYSVSFVGGSNQRFLATATSTSKGPGGAPLTIDETNARTGW